MKNKMVSLFLVPLIVIFSVSLLAYPPGALNRLLGFNVEKLLLIYIVIIVVAVKYLTDYLSEKSTNVENTFLRSWETSRLINKLNSDLKKTMEKLDIEIEKRKTLKSSEKLFESEYRNLFNQISVEITTEKLQEDARNKILAISKIDILRKVWQEVDNNLKAAIASSRRHQNINLVCGFATSEAAILVLLFLIIDPFDKNARATDTFGIIKHYLPWISLVIIMEIAVFFFFNMYRSNVEAEKHFLNELTTVLIRRIALEAALEGADKTTTSQLLKTLISEERNKVLRKGETSSEVERYKAETEGFEKGINSIRRLLNPYESSTGVAAQQKEVLRRKIRAK